MSSITSPNMSLTIPTVGSQPGPTYASNVNASLTLVDSHDHSPGKGVQITPAGLNINDTLDMQSNDLNNINNLIFTAQASSSVVQALYVAPGTETPAINDLYFNDGAGNIVQITANGTVNASIGSLPGESYAGGTFFWKQGAGSTTPANFDIGSITLRPNVAATINGVTLSPPSTISSSISQALPELPIGGTKIMSMNTGGAMFALIDVDNSSLQLVSNILAVKALGIQESMINTSAVTTTKIANEAVTTAKLAPDLNLNISEVFSDVVVSFNVRVATTTSGTFSTAFDNGSTVDGVVLATNDKILIKNNTLAAETGVFVVQAAGVPLRDTRYDTFSELNFANVHVTAGTINANTDWCQSNLLTSLSDDQAWNRGTCQEYVIPAGVEVIHAQGSGGGGGGGGSGGLPIGGSGCGGGGGGGGAPVTSIILIVTPGESLAITIGSGGKGGTAGTSANNSTSSGGTGESGADSFIIGANFNVPFIGAGGGGGGAGSGSGAVPTTGVSVPFLGTDGGTITSGIRDGGSGGASVRNGGTGGVLAGAAGVDGFNGSGGGGNGGNHSGNTSAGDGGYSTYTTDFAAAGTQVSGTTDGGAGGGGGSSWTAGGAGASNTNTSGNPGVAGNPAAANTGAGGGGAAGSCNAGAARAGAAGGDGGSGKIVIYYVSPNP